jgi:hypothetical protein
LADSKFLFAVAGVHCATAYERLAILSEHQQAYSIPSNAIALARLFEGYH